MTLNDSAYTYGTMNNVFISHSSTDNMFGEQLANRLKSLLGDDERVWYDNADLEPGDPFWETITGEIKTRSVFIVIVSPDSMDSKWVHDEVLFAIGERNNRNSPGKLIIPVIYAQCPMKWALDIDQGVSFLPPVAFDDAVERLYQRIVTYSPEPAPNAEAESVEQRLRRLGFTYHESKPSPHITPPFCEVPAGIFLMGSDVQLDPHSHADEWPATDVPTDKYAIATYPVTIAEYQLFLRAQGKTLPARHGGEDHPVTDISWYDAWRYAAWLSACSGSQWRLPTEAEWEKAARWDPRTNRSRAYPWGDAFDPRRCNTYESRVETTTVIGRYSDGKSSLGAYDMAGNVVEWTRSPFVRYPYSPDQGLETPQDDVIVVCRGGSWNTGGWEARCAYRSEAMASQTHAPYIGMRLVRGVE
ncbi:MAG TPA: SUMF1/EgtB/PvdO family nonheme iron enzyme [Ktedonobacterales bacterium]